jgi:uncharacterized protein YceH (UPF0502 family)
MSEAPTSWPVLSIHERRVLGVLVEKAKTTPDAYPLSLNALVTGSNQKSNRDPLLALSEADVETALQEAQQKELVTRIQGGRVEKWRHNLYELWHVNKVELAVLAELLLRGPQTEGELRGRASRMEPIADLETLRGVLRPLAERGLTVFLGPEGRRGTLITHGFHASQELESLRAAQPAEADTDTPYTAAAERVDSPPRENDLAELRAELASLRQQLDHMQAHLSQLTEQVRAVKESLGA